MVKVPGSRPASAAAASVALTVTTAVDAAVAVAAAASTIPAPQVVVMQSDPVPMGKARAVLWRVDNTKAGVKAGLADSIRDTIPVMCGAAMLVPDISTTPIPLDVPDLAA